MSTNRVYKYRQATNDDIDVVREIIYAALREFGIEPDPNGTDSDIENIETNYIEKGGRFEVIIDGDGKVMGCCGLLPLNESRIELRKMYFKPEIRGSGIGKVTLERMVNYARNMQYAEMFLESAQVLERAVNLYRRFGFIETSERHTPRCDISFLLKL
ncbi:MAG: GNAT family N-acetyltransferase [Pyrinomonadaceae bacterium]